VRTRTGVAHDAPLPFFVCIIHRVNAYVVKVKRGAEPHPPVRCIQTAQTTPAREDAMNFQKGDCFGPPPPLAWVLLVVMIVVASFAVRLWSQGFVLHAAFVLVASPEYVETALLEMVLTGALQLALFVRACTVADLTPFRIRLRARAVPPRGLGYSAASAPSA
jgi:hypothetical protein